MIMMVVVVVMMMMTAATMTTINGRDTPICATIRQKIMTLMLTAVDDDDASDTIDDRVQSQ